MLSKQNNVKKHKLSKAVLFFAVLMFVLMTGMIDYLSHGEIGFSIFYVIYVAISAWILGVGPSSFMIVLASVLRIVVLTKYGILSIESSITYVNFALYTGTLFVISLGISYFRSSLDLQKKFLRVDAITNLGNAQFLRETLSKELSRSNRSSKAFSVVVAQSDSYVNLASKYGEELAKSILKNFAQLFSTSLRETDECSFINENCFVVVLAETDNEGTKVVLNRLEQKLHSLYAQQENVHECLLRAVSFEALPPTVDATVEVIQEVSDAQISDRVLAQWNYIKNEDGNLILNKI